MGTELRGRESAQQHQGAAIREAFLKQRKVQNIALLRDVTIAHAHIAMTMFKRYIAQP